MRRGGAREEAALLQEAQDVTGGQGLVSGGGAFVRILGGVFFLFGPPVLEPNFDLRFGEIQLPRELGALAAHDVLAPLELELEPVQLFGSKGGPRALGPVQVEALWQDNLPDGAFGVSH